MTRCLVMRDKIDIPSERPVGASGSHLEGVVSEWPQVVMIALGRKRTRAPGVTDGSASMVIAVSVG